MDRARQLQSETNKVILPLVADPKKDIENERTKATFNKHDLSVLLYETEAKLKRKKELIKLLAENPDFDRERRYTLDREGVYKMVISMTLKLKELAENLGIFEQDDIGVLSRALATPSAMDLNLGMFAPTILGQGTDEQKEKYLVPSLNFDILGTYAQTELGHGTFLRGLETTATYDKQTQEFIVHTPTITATKWWPGGLAKTANHIVLMARLFIEGKDYGPHAFIVQIRSTKDHLPLAGVEVGDIGPKIGFNSVDNGFLRLDHVRIPRENMLTKNSEVTPSGEYVVKKGIKKGSYGTMIFIRATIVGSASYALGKAVTIATRYSAVRRQTSARDGELESQVLDYQTQQSYLFPQIATSFALHFTGKYMKSIYSNFQKDSKSGKMDALPEVHATSAGLKAWVTSITADGIELCRKSCGGHGFSDYSGLTILYQDYVAACTYEGENTVMHLQTARYLLKLASQVLAGKPVTGISKYLENIKEYTQNPSCKARSDEDLLNPDIQIEGFRRSAAHAIFNTLSQIKKKIDSGMDDEQARNHHLVDMVNASKAHCQVILATNFIQAVSGIANPSLKTIMKRMCDLFILHTMNNEMAQFLCCKYLGIEHSGMVKRNIAKLLAEIRPDAVTLVDAWEFDDYELCSALGRYDGDVYNALYKFAQKSPLNKTQVGPAYEPYLKKKLSARL